MGCIEDYVEAVTARLRRDPELHMDVAHELRTHLEDAAEEARARGLGEEEAEQAALKAFGDQQQLADALWSANRGRMRLHAMVKWALRLTLLPAALLVTLYAWGAPIALRSAQFGLGNDIRAVLPPRDSLTEEEQFIEEHLLFVAVAEDESRPQILAKTKALVDRHPNDPAFGMHYVRLLLEKHGDVTEMPKAEFEEVLAVLDRCGAAEPENAYYDYMKAALLLETSSSLGEEIAFSYKSLRTCKSLHKGEESVADVHALHISDRATFEAGISEMLEGVRKPHYDPHYFDALERKLQLLKAPTFLMQELEVIPVASSLFGDLHLPRNLSRRLRAYAFELVSAGEVVRAADLVERMPAPGLHMGANAQTLMELLVAAACLEGTLGPTPTLYRELGMPGRAAQARKVYEAEKAAESWAHDRTGRDELRVHHGALTRLLIPYGFDDPVAVPAMRHIEHGWLKRAGLIALGCASWVLIFAIGSLSCWGLWKHRRTSDGPKLFFVGWRRVAWIVLPALVAPAGIYWAYSSLAPFSSMRYGITYSMGRVAVELSLSFLAIIGGMMALSYRAIRARCLDAGMDVPPEGLFNPLASRAARGAAIVVVAALVVYFATWEPRMFQRSLGFYVSGGVLLVAFAYWLNQLWRLRGRQPERKLFRMTFYRSLIPILAVCLVIVGLVGGYYLTSYEAAQVRRLNMPGHRMFFDEIEMMPAAKAHRDHLRELHRQLREKLPAG